MFVVSWFVLSLGAEVVMYSLVGMQERDAPAKAEAR